MPDFIQARFSGDFVPFSGCACGGTSCCNIHAASRESGAAAFVGFSVCACGGTDCCNTHTASRESGTAACVPFSHDTWQLVRPHWLLTGAPERSWEHQTAQFNLIGREYGEDVPTGNARLTLAFETTRHAPSVAQLERDLRCHELALNLHRRGLLTLQEAWDGGAPLLTTRWQCTISVCTPRRLTSEDAPPLPGAWGAIAYELILTNPQ